MSTSRIQLFPLAVLACAASPLAALGDPPIPPIPPDPAPGPRPEVPVERARRAGVFTIYFENDWFGGTDENYSNGVKLSWLSDDLTDWGQTGWRHSFLSALPFVNRPGTQKNFGFSLGQNMYTPQDTDASVPDPTDRPYAGWSYVEFSFISKDTVRADIVSIQLGIVGPSSGAEAVQDMVHGWIGAEKAQGWDYQLEDEPGINLIYERRYRLVARTLWDSIGFDLIPHGGFSLGNVQTYANLGATTRFGLNLPSDFGVDLARGGAIGASPADDLDPRVAPNRHFSLFLFVGAEGRAVARDIFLDGNTWKESASVDKEPFVADLLAGVGLIAGRWQLTGTFVHRTKEFETQPDPWSHFGSLTLSVAF